MGSRSVEAPPLDRQLQYLLTAGTTRDIKDDLHLSNIVQRIWASSTLQDSELHKDSSPSKKDAAELQKLIVRIRSALQRPQDVSFGLRLAIEALRVLPWTFVVVYASDWIQAALTHFALSVDEAVTLLDTLLGEDARQQRPEYWRNVGSIAAPKYSAVLLDTAEQVTKADRRSFDPRMPKMLNALCGQIELHPSTFRSQAPRIHKLCVHLLFDQQRYVCEASRLLARIPSTGKGAEGQAELWSATARSLFREAQAAWKACSSTFVTNDVPPTDESSFPNALPSDELEALHVAHDRLALLLGSMPSSGILAIFLAESTPTAVPVNLLDLFDLPTSILSLSATSSSRLDVVPEASLHASQAALLPRAHLAAITFLATMPHQQWTPGGHGKTIRSLIGAVERGSPMIRCAALRTLAALRLPLDPHGGLLLRCTRTCLAQMSKLVNQEPEAYPATASAQRNVSLGGSSNKKRRLFEADQVIFKPIRGFVDLDADEYGACEAACKMLTTLFAYLTTLISSEHHDLAQTTALLFLGLSEIALKQPDRLTVCLVESLSRLVSLSRGPLLGLLSVRASTLCAQAIRSADEDVRRAAEMLNVALCDTFHPKLPPKLALRLHIEADRIGVEASGGATMEEEAKQLDDVMLDEARGTSEREALGEILAIHLEPSSSSTANDASQTHVRSVSAFPKAFGAASSALPSEGEPVAKQQSGAGHATHAAAAATAAFSPDPVKPIRRPSTPRIGSPSSITPSTSKRPSLSPEHSSLTPSVLQVGSSLREANPLPLPLSPTLTAAPNLNAGLRRTSLTSPLSKQMDDSENESKDRVKRQRVSGDDEEEEEDSDGSMPMLDVRSSSDEESAAEEEEL